MAEQKAGSKRRVRNPDTFRQRAQKAAEAPSKQSRLSQAWGITLGPVFRTLGRGLRTAARFKPLKLLLRLIFPSYFRNSWRELKQVTWPSWKQSRQLTFAVLVFAVVFGISIALVDFGLDKVFRNVLLK